MGSADALPSARDCQGQGADEGVLAGGGGDQVGFKAGAGVDHSHEDFFTRAQSRRLDQVRGNSEAAFIVDRGIRDRGPVNLSM